jgi:hypothetical protein
VLVTLKFKASFRVFGGWGAHYRWETVLELARIDLAAEGEIDRLLECMEPSVNGEIAPSDLGKGLTRAGIEHDPRYLSLLFAEANLNEKDTISIPELKTVLGNQCERQSGIQINKTSHAKLVPPELELSTSRASANTKKTHAHAEAEDEELWGSYQNRPAGISTIASASRGYKLLPEDA